MSYRLQSISGGVAQCVAFRKFYRLTFVVLGALACLSSVSNATIITLFNFNDMTANNNGTTFATVDNAVGTPTLALAEDGGLLVAPTGQAGVVAFTDEASTLHALGRSAAWTTGILNTSGNPNDSWLLNLDTTGYRDLNLRFDYRSTDAVFQGDTLLGPTQLTVDWAVGAGAYNLIQTFNLTRNNAAIIFSLDLSGIVGIENVADVKLRGTWSNDGSETITGGTAPSVRMDNLQVTGVPEPSTIALALCAAIAMLACRRR